ncbi:hypothetical protein E2C01_082045 [Portunus trituberculatus]|uniref:Uncharacterized protein n=1 Tax=Portunus trituberculatus TaxID=210409 RepID=A0A5B7IRC0_PORTR|nr:hypothetical protein [Portunus trituberculatus]
MSHQLIHCRLMSH